MRAEFLAPGKRCEGLCKGSGCNSTPEECDFLRVYREQLSRLHKPSVAYALRSLLREYGKKEVVLLVHEKVDNPCSERHHLKRFMIECGFNVVDL